MNWWTRWRFGIRKNRPKLEHIRHLHSNYLTRLVDLDVYLLDAGEPETSKALWGGHATRTVDLSTQRSSFISEGAMLQRAVELAVEEPLASLPAREAERGPTTR